MTLQDSFDHFYPQQDMSDHDILSNHEILSKHDIIVLTLWKSPLKPNFNLLIIYIDDLKQSGFIDSHAFPSTICPRDRCTDMRSETWVGSFD